MRPAHSTVAVVLLRGRTHVFALWPQFDRRAPWWLLRWLFYSLFYSLACAEGPSIGDLQRRPFRVAVCAVLLWLQPCGGVRLWCTSVNVVICKRRHQLRSTRAAISTINVMAGASKANRQSSYVCIHSLNHMLWTRLSTHGKFNTRVSPHIQVACDACSVYLEKFNTGLSRYIQVVWDACSVYFPEQGHAQRLRPGVDKSKAIVTVLLDQATDIVWWLCNAPNLGMLLNG